MGFLFSSILLIVYGLIRIIDMAKIMWIFPLDSANDITSYMAMLHFFVKYGFLSYVPNWYNGFILFSVYPPGWFFFVYPIYLIFQDVQITAYISLIIQYAFGFLIIVIFGKKLNWSWLKILAFFSLLFLNAFAIGDFIRQLRLPAFLGFEFVVLFGFLLYYYRDRILDKWFYILFIICLFSLIIVHQAEAILFSLFLLGFFLIRSFRDKIKIICCCLMALALSAFWWIPFLRFSTQLTINTSTFSTWLLDFGRLFLTNIATILIALTFFLIFYLYWRSYSFNKKIFLFFVPLLILNFLFLTRLVIFVPVLKYVYPEPFTHFFIFFILLLFFSLDRNLFLEKKLFIFLIFFALPILFIVLNQLITPYFIEYTDEENQILSLFPKISVDDKFFTIGVEYHNTVFKRPYGDLTYSSFSRNYACYGPIYYNLSTPYGWADFYVDDHYLDLLLNNNYLSGDCNLFKSSLINLNTTKVITYGRDDFELMSPCMDLLESNGEAYLFEV